MNIIFFKSYLNIIKKMSSNKITVLPKPTLVFEAILSFSNKIENNPDFLQVLVFTSISVCSMNSIHERNQNRVVDRKWISRWKPKFQILSKKIDQKVLPPYSFRFQGPLFFLYIIFIFVLTVSQFIKQSEFLKFKFLFIFSCKFHQYVDTIKPSV